MATLKELQSAKVRRLTTVPDALLAKIPQAESEIYGQVVELLARLEIKGGSYVINSANLRIAAQISDLLKQVLVGSSYYDAVIEFVKEFDTQVAISDELFSKSFPAFKASELALSVNGIAKRKAIELLLNRAADSDLIAPLRGIIEQSVINGAGGNETLQVIRDFIEGSADADGALLRYSKTYAHDTFAIADRSYTSVVSEDLGAEWFLYLGDVIATTRPFCEARHNKFFYYKEIEAWASLSEWAGRIPSTDKATIFTYAGGYNCRHAILPQSLFAVPMDVIQRNIASGNFSPTKKEAELLGLE